MPNIDVTAIIIALIAAGALDWIRTLVRARRARITAKSPEGRAAASVVAADQSITVVAKARDELEADNSRLRELLEEVRQDRARERAESLADRTRMRAEHEAEREVWRREREELRAELDAMSRRAQDLRAQLDRLYPND